MAHVTEEVCETAQIVGLDWFILGQTGMFGELEAFLFHSMNNATLRTRGEEHTTMTDSIVQAEIDRMIEALDGELQSHSRVVDGLLDLRSASGDDIKLVAVIDESLKNIPGRSTVTTDWWKTQLTTFRLMTDESVGAQN